MGQLKIATSELRPVRARYSEVDDLEEDERMQAAQTLVDGRYEAARTAQARAEGWRAHKSGMVDAIRCLYGDEAADHVKGGD